mmetsp:Transcript_61834/g.156423  ORF Transcript_61834/g.156423 Transcript_61834/m.156423 type:complete len:115 (+) Transcript_61834:1-345(+)
MLLIRYSMAFAGPELFGTFYGVLCLVSSPVTFAMQALTYNWISHLPATGLTHLRLPFQATSLWNALCLTSWLSHLLYIGLPQGSEKLDEQRSGAAVSILEGLTGETGGLGTAGG